MTDTREPIAWMVITTDGLEWEDNHWVSPVKQNGDWFQFPIYLPEQEPPCKTGSQCVGNKCERCAVQEPVAWMHNFIDEVVIAHRPVDLDRHSDRWTALYKDPTPCQTCEALARTVMMDQTSHDTPPQREWQGLTDEERQECLYSDPIFGMAASTFARAIEAKLKEKNGG